MQFIVACLLVGVALAAPQLNSAPGQQVNSINGAAAATAPAQPSYGLKAYGPGLNNPFAFPHNPFLVRSAVSLANQHPNLLVRVNVDGEVELTDQFGREVEGVYDTFGNNLAELYD